MSQWRWRISARETSSGSPGATIRSLVDPDDGGMIEADSAGEALQEFLNHGPWDIIDQQHEIIIELRPVEAQETESA